MENIENTEAAQVASEISARISQLHELMGEDLRSEMANLKTTLMANPAACLLIKDEDVGCLVASLRRVLNIAVASAATAKTKPKAPAAAKVRLTPEQLAAALDDM